MNLQLFAGGFVFTFTNNTDYKLKATYQGVFAEEYTYINPKSSISITSYSEGGIISIDNEKIVSALILPMLDYTIHDGYIDLKNWGATTKVNKITIEEKVQAQPLIINFDSGISKVSLNNYKWETSGASNTLTGLDKNKAYTFTVTNKNGYILETVSDTLTQGSLDFNYTETTFTVTTDENGFIGGTIDLTSMLVIKTNPLTINFDSTTKIETVTIQDAKGIIYTYSKDAHTHSPALLPNKDYVFNITFSADYKLTAVDAIDLTIGFYKSLTDNTFTLTSSTNGIGGTVVLNTQANPKSCSLTFNLDSRISKVEGLGKTWTKTTPTNAISVMPSTREIFTITSETPIISYETALTNGCFILLEDNKLTLQSNENGLSGAITLTSQEITTVCNLSISFEEDIAEVKTTDINNHMIRWTESGQTKTFNIPITGEKEFTIIPKQGATITKKYIDTTLLTNGTLKQGETTTFSITPQGSILGQIHIYTSYDTTVTIYNRKGDTVLATMENLPRIKQAKIDMSGTTGVLRLFGIDGKMYSVWFGVSNKDRIDDFLGLGLYTNDIVHIPIGQLTNVFFLKEQKLYESFSPYEPITKNFTVTLYKNNAETHRVDKSAYLETVTILNCVLRDECSIVNPILLLEYNGEINFNYVYIPTFNRYYYVTEITHIRTGLIELALRCDVLMSNRVTIRQQQAVILRQEFSYNNMIPDTLLPITGQPTIERINKIGLPTFDGSQMGTLLGANYIVITQAD